MCDTTVVNTRNDFNRSYLSYRLGWVHVFLLRKNIAITVGESSELYHMCMPELYAVEFNLLLSL